MKTRKKKAAPHPVPLPRAEREKKNRGGRPAIITEAVVEEVAALMAGGVPEHYACALVGVNAETFGPAVSRNPALRAIKDRHDARFIADSVKIIREGGEKVTLVTGQDKEGNDVVAEKILPWTGRAWILERRYKPHFNKTEVVKPIEGPGEGGGLLQDADMLELEKLVKARLREDADKRKMEGE